MEGGTEEEAVVTAVGMAPVVPSITVTAVMALIPSITDIGVMSDTPAIMAMVAIMVTVIITTIMVYGSRLAPAFSG